MPRPDAPSFAQVVADSGGATVVPLDPTASRLGPRSHRRQRCHTRCVEAGRPARGRPAGRPGRPAFLGLGGRAADPTSRARRAVRARDRRRGRLRALRLGLDRAEEAIRLGEAQLLHVARAVARAYEIGPGDRGFSSVPLTHVNGEVVGLLAPLVSGGTIVLDDRFHRTRFWDVVAQRAATWVNAVLSLITSLAQEPAGPGAPASVSFVRSVSATWSEPVLARLHRAQSVGPEVRCRSRG